MTGPLPYLTAHRPGAVATFAAMQMCGRVSIFGFGAPNCSTTASQGAKYAKAGSSDDLLGWQTQMYLKLLQRYHDYETQLSWLRSLVRDGRVADPEGCFQR